ncbi:uncharacterized protein EV154DRAFT_567965 [Mucor mucedo]|uniref:uncharacterized protein n=1 Tax=Mucor mucedo TaxID=29922 RepID=UPI00222101DD|nr:uncharacterized protein EV154DRAFT_567965 [Mucor mucedo]KAI7884125.1 hypothetical protein EV154DRAFT_567965 [Mucor mucedo]
MSTKNSDSKRPLVRDPEEEEYEQQNKEIGNEIQVQKEKPTKACRSRLLESGMLNRSLVAAPFDGSTSGVSSSFGSSSAIIIQASLFTFQSNGSFDVTEFELALKALPMKVRASTSAIYRMPMES